MAGAPFSMVSGRATPSFLRQTLLRTILQQSPSYRTAVHRSSFLQNIRLTRTFTSKRTPGHSILSSKWPWRNTMIRRMRQIRQNSNKTSQTAAEEQTSGNSLSVTQRFKELSRKYGWGAVGVYVGLSVLDFPFCFLAVRLIGTERIGEAEHAIAHWFWSVVGTVMPSMRPQMQSAAEDAAGIDSESFDKEIHNSHEDASIWTQLLLAYGVHKSLIFFRVPLTAAVTPKVVKTLRSWGWNIGPRRRVRAS